MKKSAFNKKTANRILTIAILALAAVIVWRFFGIGSRIRLSGAVDDILHARQVGEARKTLLQLDDRGLVVTALKEAVEEDTQSVQGKLQLLETLAKWQEPRAVRRALDSGSASSRRAAAWRFHGDDTVRSQVRGITADWIADESADARSLAALIVRKLKIKEAVPALEKAITIAPETNDEVQFAGAALETLAAFKPEGFADTVMKLARDDKQHWQLRGRAFDILGQVDAPADQVRELMSKVLSDRNANEVLRGKAAIVLGRKKFADEATRKTLEEVLFREGEDGVIQRNSLWSIAETAPLEKIRGLLLDRRVYNHPYFGIRADVANGLKALNVQEKIALEILCDYMVDDDPKDLDLLVPREAWLAYWTLTGLAYGVAQQELFRKPPRPITDEEYVRGQLWKGSQSYPGINFEMVEAVRRMVTANLDEVRNAKRGAPRPAMVRRMEDLKRVSQTCRNKIDEILARNAKRKQEEEKKKAAEKEKKDRPEIEDQGPQLPPSDEDG